MRYFYFLQQFFERLPAPACIKDTKGRIIWVNPEYLNMLGLPEEKVISKFESELLQNDSITEVDRKVMRTRRIQTVEITFNGRYYQVHRMPIRLGTGNYGVAAVMYDMTERILEQLLYKLQVFVEQKILESLTECEGDVDKFAEIFSRKFYGEYPDVATVLLKDNRYFLGLEDQKLIEKVQAVNELKTFTLEKKVYLVCPVENFKFVVRVPDQYVSVAKALGGYLSSQVLAALKVLESQRVYREYSEKLDAIVKLINLFEESESLEDYLRKVLSELVKLIPEAQKASIWLRFGDEYKAVAVYGYPAELEGFSMPVAEDTYGPVVGENRVLELRDAYVLNRNATNQELWERFGVTEPNFVPLIGTVKVGENKLVILSLDNFEGKSFSETSKKLLKLFVDLLSAYLKKLK